MCVCMCVCAYVWSQKKTLWIMDPRAFSGSIWGMILGTGVPSQQEFGSVKYTCIRTYIHAYIPTYLHTYIPTYLHTYVHTYIHPPEHTVSSGYSGVHLGPFTVLPAQDAVECAWARAHARQNARYDPKLNVRIYVR